MSRKEVALVTGGSQGIGRAIVSRLVADGYMTINVDIVPPTDQHAEYRQADLSDKMIAADTFRQIAADFDIVRLVNNVGTIQPNAIEAIDDSDIDTAVNLNWSVATEATRVAMGTMGAKGFGRIVNVSSRSALGRAQRAIYSMTKAGVIGLTRAWALEGAPNGITVNAVAPGPIETELFSRAQPAGSKAREDMLKKVPAARMGQPEEVADVVGFFLDRRTGFVTGQVIYVCGGMSIRAQLP
ncbi:MAG: SDR family oxidoreductase [Burkholderiaceae bacterium]|nr:SDR family oxidoreductase [Burkholderiaceae bacterium]